MKRCTAGQCTAGPTFCQSVSTQRFGLLHSWQKYDITHTYTHTHRGTHTHAGTGSRKEMVNLMHLGKCLEMMSIAFL